MEPLFYSIPIHRFDLGLLPPQARRPGSEEFKQAVVEHFVREYAVKDQTALVTVDDDEIQVFAFPGEVEPFKLILNMLRAGRIKEALPLLEALDKVNANDPAVLYNLGLAYSELGQYDEAIIRLKRAVAAEPKHAHAWTAIGVAYQRSGKPDLALEAFKAAVDANPDDGYSLRNYGAGLAGAGKLEDALPLLRKAVARMPEDPQALYGLAGVLESLGGAEREAEADSLQQEVIRKFPASPVAEHARETRTRRAHKSMRAAVGGGLRPDVMMYIAGAMDTFKSVGPQKRQQITFEIAILGQSGLDINDPEQKYTLKSLPGKFSGLHLLAIMYTGFKQMDPTVDPGVDFSAEYAAAMAMGKG